jgi:ABC-2 type transport system permease protein
MRCFAGSERTGVDVLYRVTPISAWSVVGGKFLAVATLFLAMLILTLIYPLAGHLLGGNVDAKVFFAYLAFFLLGLAYIGLGVLFSAGAESQSIAAIASFLAIFFLQGLGNSFARVAGNALTKTLLALGLGENAVTIGSGQVLTNALVWLNPASRLTLFGRGIFRLTPVIYFLSFTLLTLGLTCLVVRRGQARRGKEWLRLGILACLLISANFLLELKFDRDLRWDLTFSGIYSINNETKETLSTLNDPIVIWGLFDADPENQENDTVLFLEQYAREGGDKLTLLYANPETDRGKLAELGLPDDLDLQDTVFLVVNRRSGNYRQVKSQDLLVSRPDQSGEAMPLLRVEQAFTGAIHQVTATALRTAYVLRGHGEEASRPAYGQLRRELAWAGYREEIFDLALGSDIPSDADLLLMLSPTLDPNPEVGERLGKYLASGGSLLVLAGFNPARFTNLNASLRTWGVEITPNRLRETHPELRLADDPYSFVAVSPESDFRQGTQAMLAVMPREISWPEQAPAGLVRRNLLQSSNGVVAEPNAQPSAGEKPAIHILGVAVEKMGTPATRLAVIGSGESFQDPVMENMGSYSPTHRGFIQKLLGWFSTNAETGYTRSIYAKGLPSYALVITSGKLPLLYFSVYAGLFGLPLALLATGGLVYWRRQRR